MLENELILSLTEKCELQAQIIHALLDVIAIYDPAEAARCRGLLDA